MESEPTVSRNMRPRRAANMRKRPNSALTKVISAAHRDSLDFVIDNKTLVPHGISHVKTKKRLLKLKEKFDNIHFKETVKQTFNIVLDKTVRKIKKRKFFDDSCSDTEREKDLIDDALLKINGSVSYTINECESDESFVTELPENISKYKIGKLDNETRVTTQFYDKHQLGEQTKSVSENVCSTSKAWMTDDFKSDAATSTLWSKVARDLERKVSVNSNLSDIDSLGLVINSKGHVVPRKTSTENHHQNNTVKDKEDKTLFKDTVRRLNYVLHKIIKKNSTKHSFSAFLHPGKTKYFKNDKLEITETEAMAIDTSRSLESQIIEQLEIATKELEELKVGEKALNNFVQKQTEVDFQAELFKNPTTSRKLSITYETQDDENNYLIKNNVKITHNSIDDIKPGIMFVKSEPERNQELMVIYRDFKSETDMKKFKWYYIRKLQIKTKKSKAISTYNKLRGKKERKDHIHHKVNLNEQREIRTEQKFKEDTDMGRVKPEFKKIRKMKIEETKEISSKILSIMVDLVAKPLSRENVGILHNIILLPNYKALIPIKEVKVYNFKVYQNRDVSFQLNGDGEMSRNAKNLKQMKSFKEKYKNTPCTEAIKQRFSSRLDEIIRRRMTEIYINEFYNTRIQDQKNYKIKLNKSKIVTTQELKSNKNKYIKGSNDIIRKECNVPKSKAALEKDLDTNILRKDTLLKQNNCLISSFDEYKYVITKEESIHRVGSSLQRRQGFSFEGHSSVISDASKDISDAESIDLDIVNRGLVLSRDNLNIPIQNCNTTLHKMYEIVPLRGIIKQRFKNTLNKIKRKTSTQKDFSKYNGYVFYPPIVKDYKGDVKLKIPESETVITEKHQSITKQPITGVEFCVNTCQYKPAQFSLNDHEQSLRINELLGIPPSKRGLFGERVRRKSSKTGINREKLMGSDAESSIYSLTASNIEKQLSADSNSSKVTEIDMDSFDMINNDQRHPIPRENLYRTSPKQLNIFKEHNENIVLSNNIKQGYTNKVENKIKMKRQQISAEYYNMLREKKLENKMLRNIAPYLLTTEKKTNGNECLTHTSNFDSTNNTGPRELLAKIQLRDMAKEASKHFQCISALKRQSTEIRKNSQSKQCVKKQTITRNQAKELRPKEKQAVIKEKPVGISAQIGIPEFTDFINTLYLPELLVCYENDDASSSRRSDDAPNIERHRSDESKLSKNVQESDTNSLDLIIDSKGRVVPRAKPGFSKSQKQINSSLEGGKNNPPRETKRQRFNDKMHEKNVKREKQKRISGYYLDPPRVKDIKNSEFRIQETIPITLEQSEVDSKSEKRLRVKGLQDCNEENKQTVNINEDSTVKLDMCSMLDDEKICDKNIITVQDVEQAPKDDSETIIPHEETEMTSKIGFVESTAVQPDNVVAESILQRNLPSNIERQNSSEFNLAQRSLSLDLVIDGEGCVVPRKNPYANSEERIWELKQKYKSKSLTETAKKRFIDIIDEIKRQKMKQKSISRYFLQPLKDRKCNIKSKLKDLKNKIKAKLSDSKFRSTKSVQVDNKVNKRKLVDTRTQISEIPNIPTQSGIVDKANTIGKDSKLKIEDDRIEKNYDTEKKPKTQQKLIQSKDSVQKDIIKHPEVTSKAHIMPRKPSDTKNVPASKTLRITRRIPPHIDKETSAHLNPTKIISKSEPDSQCLNNDSQGHVASRENSYLKTQRKIKAFIEKYENIPYTEAVKQRFNDELDEIISSIKSRKKVYEHDLHKPVIKNDQEDIKLTIRKSETMTKEQINLGTSHIYEEQNDITSSESPIVCRELKIKDNKAVDNKMKVVKKDIEKTDHIVDDVMKKSQNFEGKPIARPLEIEKTIKTKCKEQKQAEVKFHNDVNGKPKITSKTQIVPQDAEDSKKSAAVSILRPKKPTPIDKETSTQEDSPKMIPEADKPLPGIFIDKGGRIIIPQKSSSITNHQNIKIPIEKNENIGLTETVKQRLNNLLGKISCMKNRHKKYKKCGHPPPSIKEIKEDILKYYLPKKSQSHTMPVDELSKEETSMKGLRESKSGPIYTNDGYGEKELETDLTEKPTTSLGLGDENESKKYYKNLTVIGKNVNCDCKDKIQNDESKEDSKADKDAKSKLIVICKSVTKTKDFQVNNGIKHQNDLKKNLDNIPRMNLKANVNAKIIDGKKNFVQNDKIKVDPPEFDEKDIVRQLEYVTAIRSKESENSLHVKQESSKHTEANLTIDVLDKNKGNTPDIKNATNFKQKTNALLKETIQLQVKPDLKSEGITNKSGVNSYIDKDLVVVKSNTTISKELLSLQTKTIFEPSDLSKRESYISEVKDEVFKLAINLQDSLLSKKSDSVNILTQETINDESKIELLRCEDKNDMPLLAEARPKSNFDSKKARAKDNLPKSTPSVLTLSKVRSSFSDNVSNIIQRIDIHNQIKLPTLPEKKLKVD